MSEHLEEKQEETNPLELEDTTKPKRPLVLNKKLGNEHQKPKK